MDSSIVARIRAGEARSLARALSWVDNGDPEGVELLRALAGGSGRTHVIGMTGPPGSGKSSLTDRMLTSFRRRGQKVAVLAVDPSSPFTGGAILGDRLRMQSHATDPGVFIRSLASRGALGGLSRATGAACRLLEAAGYDIIIVETVGVGQSEVDIVKVADTVVLVSVPGLGDDIQVIKAGIMEIGDVFVVNKADRDGADRVVREIRAMLETAAALRRGRAPAGGPDTLSTHLVKAGHHGVSLAPMAASSSIQSNGESPDENESESAGDASAQATVSQAIDSLEIPPVLRTSAETGEGIEVMVDACIRHRSLLEASGELARRRAEAARAELRAVFAREVYALLDAGPAAALEARLVGDILDRRIDVHTAAERLFALAISGGST